jgi:hypothetical protein
MRSYKGIIFFGGSNSIRNVFLQKVHESAIGGHAAVHNTYKIVKPLFYCRGLKQQIKELVDTCDVRARNKSENVASQGLFQPLPVPSQYWSDISMELIEGLPKSEGKDVILVVDRWWIHSQNYPSKEVVKRHSKPVV